MNNWRTTKALRVSIALAMAAALALAMTGCGGDEKTQNKGDSASGAKSSDSGESAKRQSDTTKVIAEVKGKDGIILVINSVQRDSGGFVTVNGQVNNTSSGKFYGTQDWSGNEPDVIKQGSSVAGATLIDKAGKKRYYVLRDTESRCLCTMINGVDAGKTVPIFAQFPAPPADTHEVDFQLPTFPSVTVQISG